MLHQPKDDDIRQTLTHHYDQGQSVYNYVINSTSCEVGEANSARSTGNLYLSETGMTETHMVMIQRKKCYQDQL